MSYGFWFAVVGLVIAINLLVIAWLSERREERAWWRDRPEGDFLDLRPRQVGRRGRW